MVSRSMWSVCKGSKDPMVGVLLLDGARVSRSMTRRQLLRLYFVNTDLETAAMGGVSRGAAPEGSASGLPQKILRPISRRVSQG